MKNLECLVTYVENDKSIDDEYKLKINLVYGFSIFEENYQDDELLNTAMYQLLKIKKFFKIQNKKSICILQINEEVSTDENSLNLLGDSFSSIEKSGYVRKNMFYIRIYG